MTQFSYDISEDLNDDTPEGASSPSQQINLRPATTAGFNFIKMYGDRKGTAKYVDYKPAKLTRGAKWFVSFSFRNPETNKFQRFKVYQGINSIKDKQEKEDFARDLKQAVNNYLDQGNSPFEKDPELIPIKTWTLVQGLNYFKTHLTDRGLRKRTIQTYESVLRQMYKGLAPLMQTEINQLNKAQISGFLRNTHTQNKWSNTTYNNNITALRAIFNYLIEQEIMIINPAKLIKPLPASTTKHRYFDDETFEKIKNEADPVLLRFLMFLYHTGTRPNEARQLRYEHIIRERKLLRVPAGISKNKKDDYVPLSDYVIENYKGEGLIFGTSVNYFTQRFNKLKVKLKLPKEMSLYSIKHTRCIHLAQDKVDPYAIMQLFRHSGLDITMKYLKDLGISVDREAAEKVR